MIEFSRSFATKMLGGLGILPKERLFVYLHPQYPDDARNLQSMDCSLLSETEYTQSLIEEKRISTRNTTLKTRSISTGTDRTTAQLQAKPLNRNESKTRSLDVYAR
ncbi:hypothetical protein SAMN04488694_101188 [Natrinema hispanicum]|uniref:Uncharacterized protein n=1 Tax=Natrinema hispanicum TaxID=392421 RepID=A0A1H9YP89_9EURY|nr:hypothetical protein SAMN04488694_101188 [Natrinema hispanicum]